MKFHFNVPSDEVCCMDTLKLTFINERKFLIYNPLKTMNLKKKFMKTTVHKETFSSIASLETDPGSMQG